MNECIRKMWCTNAKEYYSAIKMKFCHLRQQWIGLDSIIFREIIQAKKEKLYDLPYLHNLKTLNL
jgi:hypothetical protein